MNDKPEQLPEDTGKRRASYRPILITLLCALLLGGGSCFGFFATLKTLQGTNPPMNGVFAMMFIGCVLIFIGTFFWLIVVWFKRR
jgi:hypothetical protein